MIDIIDKSDDDRPFVLGNPAWSTQVSEKCWIEEHKKCDGKECHCDCHAAKS